MSGRTDERHQNLDLIVLATRPLGDNDRIVRLLASGSGRLDAVARGAGRERSRFRGRLESFTRMKASLYRRAGGDLWTLREAEITALPPILTEWRRSIALQSGAELLLHSGPYEGMHEEFFALAALFPVLLEAARDPLATTAAFAARWSQGAGFGLPAVETAPAGSIAIGQAQTFFQRALVDPPEFWTRYTLAPATSRAVEAMILTHVEYHIDRAWNGWRLLAKNPPASRT